MTQDGAGLQSGAVQLPFRRTLDTGREVVPVVRPTRLLALGALVLVGVLYWKPIRSYEHTKAVLDRREAEVSRLEAQQHQLKARIATVGTGSDLVREARRLGFVKPGEQLFIVRGIAGWRATHK